MSEPTMVITERVVLIWGCARNAAVLVCPACGSYDLHQTGVTTYDRKEDAATVARTNVAYGQITSETVANTADNPSGRRRGLAIDFECEGCDTRPLQMCVAQHKGSTLVSWRYVERPDGDLLGQSAFKRDMRG